MVGIVLVSHSKKLVEGALELINQMNHANVPVAIAGGTQNKDAPIGTDPMLVLDAFNEVFAHPNYSKGVIILMDIGSALMSAEAAIDFLTEEQKKDIHLCSAPIIEGGIVAMCSSMIGNNANKVLEATSKCLDAKISQIDNN